MYTTHNYRTKKALKEDIAAGKEVTVYQPGPFGGGPINGIETVEGPHYPEPHKWYARVSIENGVIKKFIS